jgi:hypothetical protein
MFKPLTIITIAALSAGGWYFLNHYRVQGLENLKLEAKTAAAESVRPGEPLQPGDPPRTASGQPAKRTIRIASANLALDAAKMAKPQVVGKIAQVLRQFDIVALQDIQARDQGLLVQLLEQVNAQGRRYNYATPPAVGREPVVRYSAFLFDEETIQIDRGTVACVENRNAPFRHPPLVAAFQCRGPAPREAFTFTLINVQTTTDRLGPELDLLASVYRAVRDDGRNEDDILLLGDLEADEDHLGELGRLPNITCAISGVPTTTRGTRLVDNILFDRRATVEYTRRSGVVDLMREFNLSTREVMDISEHLPVWAEFSIYEGGLPGAAAP